MAKKKCDKGMMVGIIIVVIILIGIALYLQQPAAEPAVTPEEGGPPAVPEAEEEGILSADEVDYIPKMTYEECMAEIQTTNPEMSDSDARDNCIAIDAINAGDATMCSSIINPEIRQACIDNIV